jgi:hypothetical protein
MYKQQYTDSAKYPLPFGLMATVKAVNNNWGQASEIWYRPCTPMCKMLFIIQKLQSWRKRET